MPNETNEEKTGRAVTQRAAKERPEGVTLGAQGEMSPLLAGEFGCGAFPGGIVLRRPLALGLVAVQDGQDGKPEDFRETRSDVGVHGKLPALIAGDGALVLFDRVGYLLLGEPLIEACLPEVVAHGWR